MCTEHRPVDCGYEAWIAAADDNRYGGSWYASYWDQGDGGRLAHSDHGVTAAEAERRRIFLAAMLAGFPEVPAGWDGWWTFPRLSD